MANLDGSAPGSRVGGGPGAPADAAARTAATTDALWARLLREYATDQAARPAVRVASDDGGLIAHAARVFGLSAVEETILTLLLGVAWGRGARNRPLELRPLDIIDLLGGDAAEQAEVVAAFAAEAPLTRWGLLAWRQDGPRLGRACAIDDDVWPRFFGGDSPSRLRARTVDLGLEQLALAPALAATCAELTTWLARAGAWPTVIAVGAPGSGRGAIARAWAHALGVPIIVADGAHLERGAATALRRECAWHQAALIIDDVDRAPTDVLGALIDELAGPLFVTAASAMIERLVAPGRAIRAIDVPALSPAARAGIWTTALARAGVDGAAIDAANLATRFAFAPARIATAVELLVHAGPTVDTEHAARVCRSLPEVRVGGLAARLETGASWDDLVVAPAVRRELELIATWGHHRAHLFGPDGDGARARAPRGLACLLHGPAGTGKTLAAQVIAADLGLELYRVDLAAVVDKYIGETEKRLDLLFREAQAAGVMLFFDEADALFAQRTDVHDARDRYANLETGFLLQRLEDHAGVTILASNHQGNIDPAFHRRLSVIVELPLPSATHRRTIWRKHLPADAIAAADIEQLAALAELSGGDIRNAVVFAVMYAKQRGERLATAHLMIGAWREMVRAGRLVDPVEFGAWKAAILEYATVARR